MLKRTPLYETHQRLGARLVEFGGWEMPVQYTGIMDEHQAVRNAAGLFDISHMGEVTAKGPRAGAFLDWLLTNQATKLTFGEGHYTQLCNEQGGVIDDLYAYRTDEEDWLLVINASRIEDDWAWIQAKHAEFPGNAEVRIVNESEALGAIAVQGPKVAEFIDTCFPGPSTGGAAVGKFSDLAKNQIAAFSAPGGNAIWISRTGYTGEDGFEVIAPAVTIAEVWEKVSQAGAPCGLKPAGLGARDTLRTEMCYPLYGHELSLETTPLEAGIGWSVALDGPDFIGKEALVAQKAEGVKKRCIAFKMTGKSAPPRPDYAVYSTGSESVELGKIASGTQSPSLGCGIGLAYVPVSHAKKGTELEIEIRGRRFPAVVSAKPLYKPASPSKE